MPRRAMSAEPGIWHIAHVQFERDMRVKIMEFGWMDGVKSAARLSMEEKDIG